MTTVYTDIKLHAQAKQAMVTIDGYPNRIHLFVQDDGRGLSKEDITKEKRGLTRIQNHVTDLAGAYEMNASQDGGVAHWIYIPLPPVRSDQTTLEMKISLSWLATLAPHPSVGCVAPNNGKALNYSRGGELLTPEPNDGLAVV